MRSMGGASRSGRVFVIDDDDDYLTLTARVLRKGGYDVLTRSETLGACAEAQAYQPDLILIDLNMPGMSGDQLMALMQRNGMKAKLALYSGMDDSVLSERARACKAHAVIPKGLPPSEFLERVAALLGAK
jgi:DNA-binding response OmpR family regulator